MDAARSSLIARMTKRVQEQVLGVGVSANGGNRVLIDITRHEALLDPPPEAREAAERALAAHPQGCPAHESVKGAIAISWDARLRVGDEVVSLLG